MQNHSQPETMTMKIESYKINLVFKKTNLVLYFFEVRYLNCHCDNAVLRSKLRQHTINKIKSNLYFLRLNFFYRIGFWL